MASKGAQTHTSGHYSGGAATVFNETGHLALNSTRVQAVGTSTAALSTVSGQTSIESGGTLGLDANSVLVGTTDLSIVQGQGDITINIGRGVRRMPDRELTERFQNSRLMKKGGYFASQESRSMDYGSKEKISASINSAFMYLLSAMAHPSAMP